MTAYVISDVVGLDPELVARHRTLSRDSIARYDGRYLTNAGNAIDQAEGEWKPQNIVLLAFPSMERAREWYASEEYAEALVVRRTVAGADEEAL